MDMMWRQESDQISQTRQTRLSLEEQIKRLTEQQLELEKKEFSGVEKAVMLEKIIFQEWQILNKPKEPPKPPKEENPENVTPIKKDPKKGDKK
jgi:hypothetical protein